MLSSKILFLSSVSFIAGIFLAGVHQSTGRYLPVLFILGFCLAISLNPVRTVLPVVLILIFVGLGSFWFSVFNTRESVELSSFRGTVIEQPEIREKSAHFVLSGGLLLVTERHAGYQYGDVLEIRGEITSPEPFNGFDYPGYLARRGIHLVTYRPEVEVVGHKNMDGAAIVAFREKASDYLAQSLPQPHSSIAAAMFLGKQRDISAEWRERLSASGVGHIVSVSGHHVTVVVAIISVLLAGFGKRRALLFIAGTIFLFVLMTGLQAPAIRAGIMGGSLVLAGFFGRMNSSLQSVIIAATLMLIFNPLLLWHDIGFQLSFLAVIGLIRLSPLIETKLLFLPPIAREVTAMSLSAYLFTLPMIIHHFGEISLVFLAANLLIVPVLHITMLLGLAFIILSFVSGTIASIVLLPLWLFITYLVVLVHFFAGLPWSSVALGSIGPVAIFASYVLLIIISGKKEPDSIESVRPIIEDKALYR